MRVDCNALCRGHRYFYLEKAGEAKRDTSCMRGVNLLQLLKELTQTLVKRTGMEWRGIGRGFDTTIWRLNHQIPIFLGCTIDGVVHMCHTEFFGRKTLGTELLENRKKIVVLQRQPCHTNIADVQCPAICLQEVRRIYVLEGAID